MRFNAAELKHLSVTVPCKFEGLLSLREKEGKLWNKTDGKYIHPFYMNVCIFICMLLRQHK